MKANHEVKPCRHVQRYVESQALGKPVRWWNLLGWLHVRNCPKCQEALDRLNAYFNAIQPPKETGDSETAEKIMSALREHSNQVTDQ